MKFVIYLYSRFFAIVIWILYFSFSTSAADIEGEGPWLFVSACRVGSDDSYIAGGTILILTYIADESAPGVWLYRVIEGDADIPKNTGTEIIKTNGKQFLIDYMASITYETVESKANSGIFEVQGGIMSMNIAKDVFEHLKQEAFFLVKNLKSFLINKKTIKRCEISYTETESYFEAIGRK